MPTARRRGPRSIASHPAAWSPTYRRVVLRPGLVIVIVAWLAAGSGRLWRGAGGAGLTIAAAQCCFAGMPAAAHRARSAATTGAGAAPGRSAHDPPGKRRTRTPPPGSSPPAPRCRNTGAAPGTGPGLLDVSRFADDQHRIRAAQGTPRHTHTRPSRAASAAHRAAASRYCIPVRGRIPGQLGDRPAVLAPQPGQ